MMGDKDRVYSIDTSALIDGLERYYPEDAFPGIWVNMEGLVGEGRLLLSEEAWEEARIKDDAVKTWCDRIGRQNLVIPTDAAIALEVARIQKMHPRLTMQLKGRNRADPFVIAVATLRKATVITGEGSDGTANRPKIPYVCNELGVQCVRFIDIIRLEGWKFAAG